MQWSPGSVAELTVTFTKEDGTPVDPSNPVADIFGPDGQKVDDGIPERISTGFYKFAYSIPLDAIEGLWRVDWTANVGTLEVFGTENFEVADAGVIVNPSDSIMHSRLRARLAESKTDPDGDGSETFFTDDQITDLLSYAANDLDGATLEGWLRKQARYSRLVDVSESGTDRKMSQKFKNASAQVKFWSDFLGGIAGSRQDALAGRVVGRAVNLRCEKPSGPLTPFSGYADHIREYPLHRFLIPAILG